MSTAQAGIITSHVMLSGANEVNYENGHISIHWSWEMKQKMPSRGEQDQNIGH